MKRSPALLFGVAAAGVGLDQWAKYWATHNLAFREPVRVVGELVQFTYTRNSGIAFGMFAGQSFPFYIFSIVASLAVVWLWARHERLPVTRQLSLALILGGAVGNLIDRVRMGEVTDFILLSWRGHDFPVFNVRRVRDLRRDPVRAGVDARPRARGRLDRAPHGGDRWSASWT